MKIAVIGCGDWGKNSARTLSSLNALGGIVDYPSPEKEDLAKLCNSRLSSLDEILRDTSISGCVVATPTSSHFPVTEACLKAGKHVLLEKPFTASVSKAKDLDVLADQYNCVLMVGHLLRYHPGFIKISEWVKEGRLGQILTIESFRKNLGKFFLQEGVHWDMAPHDLSMIQHLMNGQMPDAVFATSQSHFEPHSDFCTIVLKYGKKQAKIHLSRMHFEKEQKLVVIGDKGAAVFDDTKPWSEKISFHANYAKHQEGSIQLHRDFLGEKFPLEPSEPLRLELEHFLHCIQTQSSPQTPASDALKILKIIDSVDESLEKDVWVSF